eukprot:TRINITY_DN18675_c0_g1_i2.p1 TRINITY_DN18675_c0_g1~~TRINITY_DN18675_c0_g1_i2.p1  ORF type:complete len:222 (-),score=88.21 TRINITY_DN18675_c0_g1_i2:125-706(-)
MSIEKSPSQMKYEAEVAAKTGAIEMLKWGTVGLAGGIVGVAAIDRLSPKFRALPYIPVKMALVVMSTAATATVFGERLVTKMAQRSVEQHRVIAEQQTWLQTFNDWKYPVIGTMWLTCVVGSFVRSYRVKPNLDFPQRLIDARLFAQVVTLGAAGLLGLSTLIEPDINKKQYSHGFSKIQQAQKILEESNNKH